MSFPISFSVIGYEFESSVRVLRESYSTARAALSARSEAIERQLGEYLASQDRGEPWIGERDEEGYILWDQEQILELDLEAALEAVNELRKAYVIAIYHLWERSARRFTNCTGQSHNDVVSALAKDGIGMAPRLEGVWHLSNLLKHNSRKWAEKLQQSWPDVVGPNLLTRKDGNLCDSVLLSDAHIEEMLITVAASGPVGFATNPSPTPS